MKLILLLSLIAIGCIGNAQVRIITAVDTSLYTGVDNPVTIQSTIIPLNELKLRTGSGELSGKDGNYNIKCSRTGSVLLDVIHNNKVVASKKININKINDPVAYALGNKLFTDTIITKKQLSSLRSLVIKINYPLLNFSVVSFTTEIIHNGKSTGTIQTSGRDISPGIKTLLSYAVTGDEVVFDQIRVLSPDASKKFVPSIKLKVIE